MGKCLNIIKYIISSIYVTQLVSLSISLKAADISWKFSPYQSTGSKKNHQKVKYFMQFFFESRYFFAILFVENEYSFMASKLVQVRVFHMDSVQS